MSASPNENTVPPHFLSLKRASSLVKGLFTAFCGKLSDKTVTLKSFAEAVRLIFSSDFTDKTKCNQTIPLAQYVFQSQFTSNYPMAFASYLMAMAPVLIVYIFAQKWVVGGVMRGAVK